MQSLPLFNGGLKMANYELERAKFYRTIVKMIETGISNNKYFYNNAVFCDETGSINNYMKAKFFSVISEMFPNSDKSISYLHYRNTGIYPSASWTNYAKEIGRIATFSYYRDKFKQEGKIDLDMNILDLNIPPKSLNLIRENITANDVITLRDVISITTNQVLNWNNSHRYNRKHVIDLTNFCSDIISDLINSDNLDNNELDIYHKELLLKSKGLLNKIETLEQKYDYVYKTRKDLELQEQSLLEEIEKCKSELLELNSLDKIISIRK